MSVFKEFLLAAFPHVDTDLVHKTATFLEVSRATDAVPDGLVSKTEHEEILETLKLYQEEIGRLNTEIVRHRDGVEHASRAGLDVLGERARQRRLEGYDDTHDDGHDDYSLSAAAIAYAMDARLRATSGKGFDHQPPVEWPWAHNDWKPKQVRQSLVVAAALLIAEIERFDRIGARS